MLGKSGASSIRESRQKCWSIRNDEVSLTNFKLLRKWRTKPASLGSVSYGSLMYKETELHCAITPLKTQLVHFQHLNILFTLAKRGRFVGICAASGRAGVLPESLTHPISPAPALRGPPPGSHPSTYYSLVIKERHVSRSAHYSH